VKVAGGTRVSSRGSLLCWSSVVRPTGLLGLVWSASAAGGRWGLRRAELLLHAGRRELRSHGACFHSAHAWEHEHFWSEVRRNRSPNRVACEDSKAHY
jgi:hypothetical protein